jgi:hypothetical protein
MEEVGVLWVNPQALIELLLGAVQITGVLERRSARNYFS